MRDEESSESSESSESNRGRSGRGLSLRFGSSDIEKLLRTPVQKTTLTSAELLDVLITAVNERAKAAYVEYERAETETETCDHGAARCHLASYLAYLDVLLMLADPVRAGLEEQATKAPSNPE